MNTIEEAKVAETLAYCWSHCDTVAEEDFLLFVAEKLAESLRTKYEFINHKDGVTHTIDGEHKVYSSQQASRG